MSRRDEYEDDYDDRPRGRSRRDDYDDEPPRRSGGGSRSGLVTAMGVIHIVVGSLGLISGLCTFAVGVFATGAGAEFNRAGMPGGRGATAVGAMVIIGAIIILAAGGGALAGGIGTLQRKFWGWVLGLVAASLASIMAILNLISMIQAFGLPSGWPGKGSTIAGGLIGFMLALGYAVFVFVVSFQPRVRSEFR